MEAQDLDSTLWQQLPFELLENILTKLPVSALMSFCQVCKRWKTLIQSPQFARRCDSLQPLVFFHHAGSEEEPWYDSENVESGSENRVSGPYLAVPNTKRNTWEKHTLNFASGSISVVAADQGLICFQTESFYRKNTLYIYNPLTRQSRELGIPVEDEEQVSRRFTAGECKLVGLIVDQKTGNYKLVVGCMKIGIPTRTLIYESDSSTWTSTSVYRDFPVEYELPGYWKPGASVRSGENLYWLVEETVPCCGTGFRFIVTFDVKTGTWTADEPDLPYQRFVTFPRAIHSDFPYTLLELALREPYGQLESNPPQWNFHLAPHDGVVYVMLFDSLLRREAYSGRFSGLIPEVKILNPDFVCKVWELANPPEHYLPTKAASQGEVWYVVFEYGGVRREERAPSDTQSANGTIQMGPSQPIFPSYSIKRIQSPGLTVGPCTLRNALFVK